jgi:hypothetical protein
MTHTTAPTWFPRVAAALVAGLALAPLGCGGGTGTVTGKVTYNGEPLPSGTVVFWNTDGKGTKEAEIQADGSYTIEQMPAGPAKVAVMTPHGGAVAGGGMGGPPGRGPGGGPPQSMVPPADKIPPGVDPGKMYGSGKPEAKKSVKIPDSYADPQKSGLTYTVTRGPQEWNIPLK